MRPTRRNPGGAGRPARPGTPVEHGVGDRRGIERAPEGPRQSPSGGCHQVVQRGRLGLVLPGVDAVVLGDSAVHAEHDRLLEGREDSGAQRTPCRVTVTCER